MIVLVGSDLHATGEPQDPSTGRPSVAGRPTLVLRRLAARPVIDGRLDDEVWRTALIITEFVQMNSLEGAPASKQTEVFVVYDSDTFYLGVHAHYSDTSLIRANRVERDQTARDDRLAVYFDPFLDRQRAYMFSVNGYGV